MSSSKRRTSRPSEILEEDLLTCPICIERLEEPKSLPCLHTFCKECLEKHYLAPKGSKLKISCPTCREEHAIPPDGIAGFRNDFRVQTLAGYVKMMKDDKENIGGKCYVCSTFEVDSYTTHHCTNCALSLCEACVETHNAQKGYARHHVIQFCPITEQNEERVQGAARNPRDFLKQCSYSDSVFEESIVPDDQQMAALEPKLKNRIKDVQTQLESLMRVENQLREQKVVNKCTASERKETMISEIEAQYSDVLATIEQSSQKQLMNLCNKRVQTEAILAKLLNFLSLPCHNKHFQDGVQTNFSQIEAMMTQPLPELAPSDKQLIEFSPSNQQVSMGFVVVPSSDSVNDNTEKLSSVKLSEENMTSVGKRRSSSVKFQISRQDSEPLTPTAPPLEEMSSLSSNQQLPPTTNSSKRPLILSKSAPVFTTSNSYNQCKSRAKSDGDLKPLARTHSKNSYESKRTSGRPAHRATFGEVVISSIFNHYKAGQTQKALFS